MTPQIVNFIKNTKKPKITTLQNQNLTEGEKLNLQGTFLYPSKSRKFHKKSQKKSQKPQKF